MTEELTPEQEVRIEEVRQIRYSGIKAAKKQQNQEAEILYRQALHLHEEILGASNPAISDSLNQLIFFCAHSEQNAEAKVLIERALVLLRQKPRPAYRGILRTLNGLARYYHERGSSELAEWCCKQVLSAREDLLGPSHPSVAVTLSQYAELLRAQDRIMEANALEERAKAIRAEREVMTSVRKRR